jgi:hypothetical protein
VAKLNNVFEHYRYEYRASRDFQRFVEARLGALAREIDETTVAIGTDWHESGAAGLSESTPSEEHEEQSAVAQQIECRTVVIPLDGGLDIVEFDRRLAELVRDQFLPVHWLNDQVLADGTRAHLLVGMRHAVGD